MFDSLSSSDFPLSLASREIEMSEASNVAATNAHVHQFFEALLQDWIYCLEIKGEKVLLEWKQDVDVAYRLFLASPQENQNFRRQQAKIFFREGKLHLRAA